MGQWRSGLFGLAGILLGGPACALDWTDLALWDTIFGSIESESHSAFISSGGKRSFALPLEDTKGFILSSSGVSLSDARRFQRGKIQYSEIDRQSRLVFGLERSAGMVFTSVGIGPAMAQIRNDRGGGRTAFGVALNADIWIRPTSELVLALSIAGDTASQNWWNRLRIGYRPEGIPVTLGPEFVAGMARTSGKVKLGLHASEIAIWKLNFDVSGGLMWDHNNRPDRYISFSTYLRY